jgi:hypothetical protein
MGLSFGPVLIFSLSSAIAASLRGIERLLGDRCSGPLLRR